MNIKGLDYNTDRERLPMHEYGRNLHHMVQDCIAIPNKSQRQKVAEQIVKVMTMMHPEVKQMPGYKQRMWEHLAIISDFKLDIDYPYDIKSEKELGERPRTIPYLKKKVPVRHYGALVFELFDKLKNMPEDKERDDLARMVCNQMKRDIVMYGNSAPDNDRIFSDMAHFTDGKVQLDPSKVKLDFISTPKPAVQHKNTKKRKKK